MRTKLYSDFAHLYHRVYPSFIDYEEQYRFYTGLLKIYSCKSVLEIGCGSGRLASRMLADGWDYRGMDLSPEMLDIARKEVPEALFFEGDMRAFQIPEAVDAIIIPARSLSYLLENKDISAAFQCFRNNLAPAGKLIFDVIDAATHFKQMDPAQTIIHTAQDQDTSWERHSVYQPNLQMGWTWDWFSTYFELLPGGLKTEIARDKAMLRAFLREEISLMLELNGFKVINCLEQGSYAFRTFVFVAEKDLANPPFRSI